MASAQVDGPEVEEVSSHIDVEDKSNKCTCEPQNSGKEEHHEYVEVEEEEDPEDLENVTPDHDHDHEKGEKIDEEEEEELLMGSQIVDEGEKPTAEIWDDDEEDDDDGII